jgi:Leucine-rich repeat (LRR) protein
VLKNVSKLFLSHNHLCTLEGLEGLPSLTHLSLSFNRIQDIEELSRITNPNSLLCLAVKGNFIDRHPDYRSLLLRYFPKLRELDGMPVGDGERTSVKEAEMLRGEIMRFFYKMD